MKYARTISGLCIACIGINMANTAHAYTCTFKNNTHANLIIRFYRDSGKSDETVVPPLQTVTWNAGRVPVVGAPWSIKGIKIFSMVYNNKTIYDAVNKEDYWSTSRPYNPTWELFEEFPVEAGQVANKVKFTLKRNPGGVGGSTYPGGTIWTSSIIDLTQTDQDVANKLAQTIKDVRTKAEENLQKINTALPQKVK